MALGWSAMRGRRCCGSWPTGWADRALGWRVSGCRRRHPDAAVLRDLAVVLADGGDCLSDLAVLRDQPELFGPVASTRPPGGSSSAWPRILTGWPGWAPPGLMPALAPGPPAPP
jgi:hypothetical protein